MLVATCDGLTGSTLGVAVKHGFDATLAWLCSALVFGGQTVLAQAEGRLQHYGGSTGGVIEVQPSDFDSRPAGYEQNESGGAVYPKPISVVIDQLCNYAESSDEAIVKSKSNNFAEPNRFGSNHFC
jgi:hypothetical protein